MHRKFRKLEVVEPVIASDNVDFVIPGGVTPSLPNIDNVRSSTPHGGFAPNENVDEHPVKNVVGPLVKNIVDPSIVAEVVQPAEPVEQIHVRRPVRQK